MADHSNPPSKLKLRSGISVLHTWEAPERVWHPKTKAWYLAYALVILIGIFVAVRMEYYIVVVGLIAFMALWFIQGSIPPWIVTHQITTKGIYTFNTLISWEQITHFWFAEKNQSYFLYFDFPRTAKQARLTLLVPAADRQAIFDHLIDHLAYADMRSAEYTFISPYIYGKYIPLSAFVPDLDQPKV